MSDKEPANVGDSKNGSDSSNHSFSDQDREIAQIALSEFNCGNYAACLQNLMKLEASCGQDVKLGHNKAIAEYFKSELRKTDQFRKSFSSLCAQVGDHCICAPNFYVETLIDYLNFTGSYQLGRCEQFGGC